MLRMARCGAGDSNGWKILIDAALKLKESGDTFFCDIIYALQA